MRRSAGAVAVGETVVVHRRPHAYSSHPCAARLPTGEWLVAFAQAIERRPFRHPPSEPSFYNLLTRSTDEGRTWSEPQVAPGYDWYGVETPGIAATSGAVLLNQWRFRWYPLDEARRRWEAGEEIHVTADGHRWHPARSEDDWDLHPFPYARADDGSYVHLSPDGGRTWPHTVRLDTAPYRGAFSPRGAVEVEPGHLLLALGSSDHDPLAACFVVRSLDGGRSWSRPSEAMRVPGLLFSEPSLVATGDGELLLFAREEVTGHLHVSRSGDGGRTWSAPERLPFWGFPAHAVRLADGRIVVVYGRRRPPFGIRAVVSEDEGRTFGPELTIRDDLPDDDLGYPSAIEYRPGRLFVVYYGRDPAGTTGIMGTHVDL